MKWIIYKHTNKVNGKCYIGQTKQSLNQRWRNGDGYRNNVYFYNSIIKYGWDNFNHEILEDNLYSLEQANEREIFWISKCDSFKNGYNLTAGGDNRNHLGIPVLQIDSNTLSIINSFQTIRDAENATGIDHTQISRCCRLDKKDVFAGGFYWCFQNEWNNNWTPKKKTPPASYNKKEIYQLDKSLNIINKFDSILDASKTTGITDSSIGQCCAGKRISAGNFYWCYIEDIVNFVPLNPLDEIPVIRIDKNNLENIKHYSNISIAAKENNIKNPEVISRVCKGKQITAGNYYWVYQEDYNLNWKPRNNNNFTKIRCIETGVIYNSIKDAIEKTGASSSIKRCLKNKNSTSGGYHWEYVEK